MGGHPADGIVGAVLARDAVWIAETAEYGMIRASRLPSPVRELRDLTGRRGTQIAERHRLPRIPGGAE